MMTAGTIDSNDLRRIETHDEAATRAGFTFTEDTLYAWGTQMTIGNAVVAERREEWAGQPSVAKLPETIAAVAKIEQRRDFDVAMTRLNMSRETGGIRTVADDGFVRSSDGAAGAPITPWAMTQLLARAGAPGAAGGYLATVGPELRAPHFNHWMKGGFSVGKKGQRSDTLTKLRTKMNASGERGIFAAVSPRYRVYDLADAAADITAAVDQSGKVKVISDGVRWEVTITFPNQHHALRVGDIQDAMIRVWSADDGSGAFGAQAGLNRIRCLNASLIPATQMLDTVAHNRKDMAAKVKETIAAAFSKVSEFAGIWAEAAKDSILDGIYQGVEVKTIFATLVDKGLVHATHCRGEELVARLVKAWEFERGYTRADIANAITRCAHTESWASVWTTRDLEEQAGQLLYQHVQLTSTGSAISRLLEID